MLISVLPPVAITPVAVAVDEEPEWLLLPLVEFPVLTPIAPDVDRDAEFELLLLDCPASAGVQSTTLTSAAIAMLLVIHHPPNKVASRQKMPRGLVSVTAS
jgi:hypothetical protein